jgi:hypothetical protein
MPSEVTQNIASVSAKVARPIQPQLPAQRVEQTIAPRTEFVAASEASAKRAAATPGADDKRRGAPVQRQVAATYSPQDLKKRTAEPQEEGVERPEPRREGQSSSLDLIA